MLGGGKVSVLCRSAQAVQIEKASCRCREI